MRRHRPRPIIRIGNRPARSYADAAADAANAIRNASGATGSELAAPPDEGPSTLKIVAIVGVGFAALAAIGIVLYNRSR